MSELSKVLVIGSGPIIIGQTALIQKPEKGGSL